MTKDELLAAADRMRQVGGADRGRVLGECEHAAELGDITFDEITPVYRHMMIHAGVVQPTTLGTFRVCPVCEARLEVAA